MIKTTIIGTKKLRVQYAGHDSQIVGSFNSFYEKEYYPDLIFICSNNVQVKAHKIVVGAVSTFIKGMIESVNEHVAYITLPDITDKNMKLLLTYLYEGETKVNQKDLLDLQSMLRLLEIHLPSAAFMTVDLVSLKSPNSNEVETVDLDYDKSAQNVALPATNIENDHTTAKSAISDLEKALSTPLQQSQIQKQILSPTQPFAPSLSEKVNSLQDILTQALGSGPSLQASLPSRVPLSQTSFPSNTASLQTSVPSINFERNFLIHPPTLSPQNVVPQSPQNVVPQSPQNAVPSPQSFMQSPQYMLQSQENTLPPPPPYTFAVQSRRDDTVNLNPEITAEEDRQVTSSGMEQDVEQVVDDDDDDDDDVVFVDMSYVTSRDDLSSQYNRDSINCQNCNGTMYPVKRNLDGVVVQWKCYKCSGDSVPVSSPSDEVLRFKCFKCNIYFRTRNEFLMHVSGHEGDSGLFICNQCNRSFQGFKVFKHHMSLHTVAPKRQKF